MSIRYCVDCSNGIPSKRIELIPTATRCISCETEYEKTHNIGSSICRSPPGTRNYTAKKGKQLNKLKGKGALIAAGYDAVITFLVDHTQAEAALKYGFIRSDGTGNGGSFRNAWNDLIDPSKDGRWADLYKSAGGIVKAKAEGSAESTPRQKKVKGVMPLRIENWIQRKLENAFVDDGHDADDYIPVKIDRDAVETFITADSAAWNAICRKLGEEELALFEAFLGAGATMNRRAVDAKAALAKGAGRKVHASLKAALSAATGFNSDMALAIAALMQRFGFEGDIQQ